jgi:hypothetical protein
MFRTGGEFECDVSTNPMGEAVPATPNSSSEPMGALSRGGELNDGSGGTKGLSKKTSGCENDCNVDSQAGGSVGQMLTFWGVIVEPVLLGPKLVSREGGGNAECELAPVGVITSRT